MIFSRPFGTRGLCAFDPALKRRAILTCPVRDSGCVSQIWNWRKPAFVCYSNAMKKTHIGSDFDDFLKEEDLLAECEAGALKRVVTWQIEQEMKRRKISRAKLASRMNTSKTALEKLFAADNSSVTLQILEQAALALGRKLKVELA